MAQVNLFFLLRCCVFCFLTVHGREKRDKEEQWDMLLFAQFWPQSSCEYFEEKVCVPKGVNGFTIHGLWPSKNNTREQPEFCNKSMPFDMNQIANLRPMLDAQWPYYNTTGDPTELWQHEWEKHGTCAIEQENISGEQKYFSKTLAMHSQIDIAKELAAHRIVPSDTTMYKPEDVFNILNATFKHVPNLVCIYKNEKYYLSEVWLCYDKEFNMQDCGPVEVMYPNYLKLKGYPQHQVNKDTEGSVLRFKSEGQRKDLKVSSFIEGCSRSKGAYYLPIIHL